MALNPKLALLVNKIPLNPIDSPTLSLKSQTRNYLSPFRYRKSPLRPTRLPKLGTTVKLKKDSSPPPEFFIKYSNITDLTKLQSLINHKSKLSVTQRHNNAYIKNSSRKKNEEVIRVRSNQQSPVPILLAAPSVNIPQDRSITPLPKMVDATFNTDF